MAEHQRKVPEGHSQVKPVLRFNSLISHNRKIWRGGFSYVLNEEQEELLHKLRDFNTLRDNAGAWEENLLTAEELI